MTNLIFNASFVLLLACGDAKPSSVLGPTYPRSVELPELIGTHTYRATMLVPAAANLISVPGQPPLWGLPDINMSLIWRNEVLHKHLDICAPPEVSGYSDVVANVAHEVLFDGTLDSCNLDKGFGVVRAIRIEDDILYCVIDRRTEKEAPSADRITAEAICKSIFFEWDRDGDPTLPSRFKGCTATLSFGKNHKGEPAWLQHETCPPDHPYKR